jgi:hypothetical protein
MTRNDVRRVTAVGIACVILGTLPAAPVHAQLVPRRNWALYGSPATAASAEIHATADLVRAYGEANVDDAAAREIRARAMRQEIDNSVEFLKAYWERRSINEAERLKRYVSPLQRADRQNSKTWERLRNHPELNGPAIVEGSALNFLLNRLAGGALAYQFSEDLKSAEFKTSKELHLDPEIVHRLRLKRDSTGGKAIIFRADEGVTMTVEWWPYALRGDEFARHRRDYDQARSTVVLAARKGSDAHAEIGKLSRAFAQLDDAFRKQNDRETRFKSQAAFQHYSTAKRFLQSLAGEVLQFQVAGGAHALEDDSRFRGDHLIALLTHMSRHGLEFAPALHEDEFAYHTIFTMMRDVYFAVAPYESSEQKR